MRSSRLLLLAAGVLFTSLVTVGAGSAQACPGQDGACACAKAAAADTGAADKAAPACAGHGGKDCACSHDKDGKCACGADCKAGQGGECKHGAATDQKPCSCAPGADGKCACGAECPAGHGGECTHGKKEGACGSCGGGCGGGAAAPSGEHLKAAIDPATGAFVEPAADDDAQPAKAAAAPAREIAQPGGGVMAAAPADLAPKAVAAIDGKGETHAGCAE